MLDKIEQAREHVASQIHGVPLIGMIAGTGLGAITGQMHVTGRIPYEQIPHFPKSTVKGHGGNLAFGTLSGKTVIALEGRFHLYEGYAPQEVALPVRVMARLGARYLLISSAVGGLNPLFKTGDFMVVTDHINLTGASPLVGPNMDLFGPRFPDMSRVYDADLADLAVRTALREGIHVRQGVYAGVLGPNLETRAETRFIRLIGADAVGMSTVCESIAAAHCGLKVLAIGVITNVNLADCMQETSLEDVLAAAGRAGVALSRLWEGIIEALPEA
jgi:purine-nucleoside phosphorylase